jgi:WS/DGAT/MGAT family acyltransferase
MHVGWAATFALPEDGRAPSFDQVLAHIHSRLDGAPRYRQKLAELPLGLGNPRWVDDDCFDIRSHVRRGASRDFGALVDAALSAPLRHDRPLWELWVADRLPDGRLGLVGKVHHCMVDGLGAVELAALLVDPTPAAPPVEPAPWDPARAPNSVGLLAAEAADRVRLGVRLALLPGRLARSPQEVLRAAPRVGSAARALAHAGRPTTPASALNQPLSPRRRLVAVARPLEQLVLIKRQFGTTVNDVVLAIAAGALRRFFEQRGDRPRRLKTMVPVSVRREADGIGNQVSCVFVDLPCDEPDAARRLEQLQVAMTARKAAGEPAGGTELLQALDYAPRPLHAPVSRLLAGSRAFNVTVSNIPGPTEPIYMLGCKLEQVIPVVPIPDHHRVSIAMTSIGAQACFGVYADGGLGREADALGQAIGAAIDELLALARRRPPPPARRGSR